MVQKLIKYGARALIHSRYIVLVGELLTDGAALVVGVGRADILAGEILVGPLVARERLELRVRLPDDSLQVGLAINAVVCVEQHCVFFVDDTTLATKQTVREIH